MPTANAGISKSLSQPTDRSTILWFQIESTAEGLEGCTGLCHLWGLQSVLLSQMGLLPTLNPWTSGPCNQMSHTMSHGKRQPSMAAVLLTNLQADCNDQITRCQQSQFFKSFTSHQHFLVCSSRRPKHQVSQLAFKQM